MSISKTILALLVSLALTNCKKALQVDYPPGQLPDNIVFGNDSATLDVVTSVYLSMSGLSPIDGPNSLYLELGLAADELDAYTTDPILLGIYTDNFSPAQSYFWDYFYSEIYSCNTVISSLPAAQIANASALRRQAVGEALFLRAFFLWYATSLYGNIPIPTTTSFQTNNALTRIPQPAVYTQVINDLTMAKGLLSADFRNGRGDTTSERGRPNRWASMALLARACLYAGDWMQAEAAADSVIADNTQYSLLTDLNQVFLVSSPETIWQIEPSNQSLNTWAAFIFILDGAPNGFQSAAMSSSLINAFDSGDLRRTNWVGQVDVPSTGSAPGATYYYPYKYKFLGETPVKESLMVMRLAELYLIRAEARARQGDLTGAVADLNRIRSRAGLPNTGAATQADLLSAIAHERQVELFTEFGDRWFDLKRTGSINSVMQKVTPFKGGVWHSYDSLFPIPASEIQLNPNLTQNPGY